MLVLNALTVPSLKLVLNLLINAQLVPILDVVSALHLVKANAQNVMPIII